MNETREKIRNTIVELIDEGTAIEVLQAQDRKNSIEEKTAMWQTTFSASYQKWYSKTLPVIRQLIPDRYQEFVEQYKPEKRKEIDFVSYKISDYLSGVRVIWDILGNEESFDHRTAFATKFHVQLMILHSCLDRLDSILWNIRGALQADLFDDELSAAEDLFKKGHLRAAGALAGVTLERHLATVAENHEVKISKKNPTIADLNETLKTAEVYDVPDWRFIQRLGDIRNLAVHNKDREPTKDEIDDLIKGTQKIIKTIF